MLKKKQSTQTELFAHAKIAKYHFTNSSHSTWWTTKKWNERIRNWYFIYQFPSRPFMSLNWYPIWFSKIRICWKVWAASTDVLITRWALTNTDKETKNGDSYAINTDYKPNDKWCITFAPSLFSFYMMNTKFLNDTRETSLLTALFFSQFVLSSCLRTAQTERLCC